MKVTIVTVYNSENCGSYWQSYALKRTLEKMGHQVFFYKRSTLGTSHSFLLLLAKTGKYCLKFKFDELKGLWKQYLAFSKIQKNFVESKENSDAYVIGSDTLWSVENKYFRDNIDLYTGSRFVEGKAFTYAISAGNASQEIFWKIPLMEQKLKRLVAISVRDEHTRELVASHRLPVCQVLDPTMLLEKREYESLMRREYNEKNYILIYTFKEFTSENRKRIEKFAQINRLTIKVYGRVSEWNSFHYAEPIGFLENFKNAKFVITDTFHGTIFSILFHKQFVVTNEKKIKVIELLRQFQMENRILYNMDTLEDTLSRKIDYSLFEKRRGKLKMESLEFIEKSLRRIEDEID